MKILGIDPGLNTTGYGVVEVTHDGRLRLFEAGIVRGTTRDSLTARVEQIHSGVVEVLASLKPDVMAIEQLYSHYKRPKTAILMGHARGVILLAAARLAIEVRSYPSTRVKRYLTGNGHASKLQVQRAVQTTLGLGELPEPTDLADALAIAMCCAAEMANVLTAGPAQ